MNLDRLIRKFGMGLLLGLLVLVGFGVWGDLSALRSTVTDIPWYYALVVLAFTFTGYILRFIKWELYLRALDIRLPIGKSAVVFLSGFSMAITPGKAGEVLKSFILKRTANIEVARSAPVVLAERATDLIALVLLASWGVSRFSYGGVLLLGTVFFLGLLIALIQSKKLTYALLSRLKRWEKIRKWVDQLEVFYESSFHLFRWKLLLMTTFISIASWFLECISLYWILVGLGLALGIGEAVFAFSFSSVAGAVSMLPGGLGVAETSLTGVLMFYGVDRVDAVAATLLVRFGTLWFGVLLGMMVLFSFSRRLLQREGRVS